MEPMIGPVPLREIWPVIPVAACCLLLYAGVISLSSKRWLDVKGAPTHVGQGKVTDVIYGPAKSGGQLAYLELDHRSVNLEGPASANSLHVGQQVTYTYRVGHSGAWYIDQIAPAGEAK